MEKEHKEEKEKLRTKVSRQRAEYKRDLKKYVSQLHTALKNSEIEKSLRKDLEDKVSDLEKELLNKSNAEDSVLTLQTKVCQLEAKVAEYKEVQEQERHAVQKKISKLPRKYVKDFEKSAAQLHTAQERLEIEKTARNGLEDEVSDLKKALLNKAKAEENMLTLQTKVCQLEAKVAEYKEVQEQERHAVQKKISILTRKCVKDLEESVAQFHSAQKDLENKKVVRNDLEDEVSALKEEFLIKAEAEDNVLTLKTKTCQCGAQVAEYKERENEWEQVLEDIFVVLEKELLKKEEVVATSVSEMFDLENQKSEMEQKREQERH
jgi:hypothetical protein